MAKIGIKVKKPFSYRGKQRKKGETLGVNVKFGEAMILLGKAERYVKPKKPPAKKAPAKKTPPKNTYSTTQVKPTATTEAKVEATTALQAEDKTADDE